MTKETLFSLLPARGIDRADVRFNDTVSDDVFCVCERRSGGIEVFYRERGKISGLKTFEVFSDALDDLADRLTPPETDAQERGMLPSRA